MIAKGNRSYYHNHNYYILCLLAASLIFHTPSNAFINNNAYYNKDFQSTLINSKFMKRIKYHNAINDILLKNKKQHHSLLFLSDRLNTIKIEKVLEPKSSREDDNIIISSLQTTVTITNEEEKEEEYKRGILTIGFITLIFASMSPAMHAALSDTSNTPPPVLLLNAVISIVALSGLIFAGPLLEASTPLPRSLLENQQKQKQDEMISSSSSSNNSISLPVEAQAGLELGLWKFLGTTTNLYGLSYTTADHGAFLIQLTTLIVPTVQGLMGVPIPTRIKTSIGLALGGVYLFTQDPAGGTCAASSEISNSIPLGDTLCVLAAFFYATYDLRLFKWGKLVKPRQLITGKIITQALLSISLLTIVGYNESATYLSNITFDNTITVAALALWSGLAVNAIAPFLQVGGQQAIGPTRAQTLYASQPLWASILSFIFLGETVGTQGFIGGFAFLCALFLAATADPPEADCGVDNCEV